MSTATPAETSVASWVAHAPTGPVDTRRSPHAALRTLDLAAARLRGGPLLQRQQTCLRVSLAFGAEQLEEHGNFHDLKLTAGLAQGPYKGPVYIDSDLHKWLEAVAWACADRSNADDPDVRPMLTRTIDLLAAAQAEDGYLNSHFQVKDPAGRFRDLTGAHELYCFGHLAQAAVAAARGAGDAKLLAVARRFGDLLCQTFGPGQREGAPGHPGPEMALVELYRQTGERRYLELARFFLDQRGRGFFARERQANDPARPVRDPSYWQDATPVREADEVVGHAVRQLYLLGGVADVYLETGEQALLDAALRQWADFTQRKMYITGGAGSTRHGEAFETGYVLPSAATYCETCAAVAVVLWAWRMLLATGESCYADVMERALYNNVLAGIGLDGRSWFYVNPLATDGPVKRQAWFGCACCPPNAMRLLASLDHYLATGDDDSVQIHHFAPATVVAAGLRLSIETSYPWGGHVHLRVQRADGATGRQTEIALRLPDWSAAHELRINGRPAASEHARGYVRVRRVWREGDDLELRLDMQPRWVEAHPRLESAGGRLAIQAGPVVYCIEQADLREDEDVRLLRVDARQPLGPVWRGDLLGGVMTVEGCGFVDPGRWTGQLYRPLSNPHPRRRAVSFTAIPYGWWANRVPGPMRVWLPRG